MKRRRATLPHPLECSTIAALRAWLKTCPLIADEQEATGAAFRIAGLPEESTAFSIEDSPGDPIVTVRDIIQFLYERPIDGKVYIDHAMKERMEAYLRQYGAE